MAIQIVLALILQNLVNDLLPQVFCNSTERLYLIDMSIEPQDTHKDKHPNVLCEKHLGGPFLVAFIGLEENRVTPTTSFHSSHSSSSILSPHSLITSRFTLLGLCFFPQTDALVGIKWQLPSIVIQSAGLLYKIPLQVACLLPTPIPGFIFLAHAKLSI